MRISDWSSDVCSSDLLPFRHPRKAWLTPGHRPAVRRRGAQQSMTQWFSDHLWLGLALLAGFIHLSGLVSALHAAVRTRTAQGAVAWSISLLTFPYVALPLSWVFGRGKFHGYVPARRSDDLQDQQIAAPPPEHHA